MARILTEGFLVFAMLLSGCQTLSDTDKPKENKLAQKSFLISLINNGKSADALKESKELLKLYPEDADLHNLQGLSYLALEKPRLAILALKQSYKLKESLPAALNISSALIQLGRYQEAKAWLVRVKQPKHSREYPHIERVYHNYGLIAEKTNRPSAALRAYDKALSFNPNFYLSLIRKGQVYRETGRLIKARKAFLKAHKVCNTCFEPIASIARILLADGKVVKASKILNYYLAKKDLRPVDRARTRKFLSSLSQKSNVRLKRKRVYKRVPEEVSSVGSAD